VTLVLGYEFPPAVGKGVCDVLCFLPGRGTATCLGSGNGLRFISACLIITDDKYCVVCVFSAQDWQRQVSETTVLIHKNLRPSAALRTSKRLSPVGHLFYKLRCAYVRSVGAYSQPGAPISHTHNLFMCTADFSISFRKRM
jgi:hypothetical protein